MVKAYSRCISASNVEHSGIYFSSWATRHKKIFRTTTLGYINRYLHIFMKPWPRRNTTKKKGDSERNNMAPRKQGNLYSVKRCCWPLGRQSTRFSMLKNKHQWAVRDHGWSPTDDAHSVSQHSALVVDGMKSSTPTRKREPYQTRRKKPIGLHRPLQKHRYVDSAWLRTQLWDGVNFTAAGSDKSRMHTQCERPKSDRGNWLALPLAGISSNMLRARAECACVLPRRAGPRHEQST